MSLRSLPLVCVTCLQKGKAMSQMLLPLPLFFFFFFCVDTSPILPHTCQRGAMSPKNAWWHCTKTPQNDLGFSLPLSF